METVISGARPNRNLASGARRNAARVSATFTGVSVLARTGSGQVLHGPTTILTSFAVRVFSGRTPVLLDAGPSPMRAGLRRLATADEKAWKVARQASSHLKVDRLAHRHRTWALQPTASGAQCPRIEPGQGAHRGPARAMLGQPEQVIARNVEDPEGRAFLTRACVHVMKL